MQGVDTYKACMFSKLLEADSNIPDHFKPETAFTVLDVGCSTVFDVNDPHQAALDGFVPLAEGDILLSEVRIYPSSLDLSTSQSAIDNKHASTQVFSFEVNVNE